MITKIIQKKSERSDPFKQNLTWLNHLKMWVITGYRVNDTV